MQQIRLYCEGCNTTYNLDKTSELPAHVFFIRSNFCPKCEDTAQDYYTEWWDDSEEGNNGQPLPMPVPDNQLCLPFVFEELEIPKLERILVL